MAKKKEWKEGEIALAFELQKLDTYYTPLLQEWLTVPSHVRRYRFGYF